MNTRSIGGISEGTVLNPKNSATGVSGMGEASLLLGFLAMGRSGKVRAFAPKKSSTLFGLGFLGSNLAKPSLPDLFSGLGSANILAVGRQKIGMSLFQMFNYSKAFKVFNSIISFVVIDMMNVFVGVKPFKPAFSYNTMKQSSTANEKIPIFSDVWGEREHLSEDFSATGYSKKVVKESVFDSVYRNACHVVPPGDCGVSILT